MGGGWNRFFFASPALASRLSFFPLGDLFTLLTLFSTPEPVSSTSTPTYKIELKIGNSILSSIVKDSDMDRLGTCQMDNGSVRAMMFCFPAATRWRYSAALCCCRLLWRPLLLHCCCNFIFALLPLLSRILYQNSYANLSASLATFNDRHCFKQSQP